MSVPNITSFAEMAIAKPVLKAIQDIGYEQPTPIQAASIPHLLDGGDLIGMAQTGTGKTAAFAMPLLTRIDLQKNVPQVLVLTPTRELAIQVAEAFQVYATNLKGFHVLPIYGGQEYGIQLRQLKRGPHVIVGTPGRVMDHLRRSSLKLDNLISLVLDEADEMLRMGFLEDVEWILEHTPKERQTALFSATMPKEIKNVAKNYLNKPKEVRIESKTSTGDNIEQYYWMVSGTNKLDALTRILEVEAIDAMLIFVRTKTATVELAEKLEARGYPASALNGDMNQQLRERTIERLKNKKLDILVATDVAARGIDVTRISHVLNYDIPYDSEAYVHRIGRTGRAGRSGKAILFVAPREQRLLRTIEKATRQPISRMELPSGETITAQRIDQFKQTLKDVLSHEDLSFFNEMLAEFSHDNDVSPEDIASALAHLCQKSRPLKVKFANLQTPKEHGRDHNKDGERGQRREHNKGGERGRTGKERVQRDKHGDEKMVRYRIEVGREHEAGAGDIVGAIANEAGLDGKDIGQIKLFDGFSTVELPDGMPKEVFESLRGIFVRGQKLNISLDNDRTRGEKDSRVKDKKRPKRADKANVNENSGSKVRSKTKNDSKVKKKTKPFRKATKDDKPKAKRKKKALLSL
ncbi:MAG: ATP-dependent RNA helicase DeaD [Planctomycetota bacterium]|jgi:ATP-dependent RNA helicase DeaD